MFQLKLIKILKFRGKKHYCYMFKEVNKKMSDLKFKIIGFICISILIIILFFIQQHYFPFGLGGTTSCKSVYAKAEDSGVLPLCADFGTYLPLVLMIIIGSIAFLFLIKILRGKQNE